MFNPIGAVVKLFKRRDKTSPVTVLPYVVQPEED